MKVKIIPGKNDNKTINIPCSKSIAHRSVICAGLANSESILDNITLSDDISATLNCMKQLKADFSFKNNKLFVKGADKLTFSENIVLDAKESGSTLRFLIPLFALGNKEVIFKGSKRLLERPLKIYEEIFNRQGLMFKYKEDGLHIKGPLKADTFEIKGDISSQFITGLLLALPLLNKDSYIKVIPPFESKSYVDITLDVLKNFNIKIIKIDDLNYKIIKNQNYIGKNYFVEGDFSQMSFFLTLGLINNDLKISGLNANSLQGDKAIIDIVKRMNGLVKEDFSCYKSDLEGSIIDINNCPDLGPILMVLATRSKGKTHIINAKRLRIKESDRIYAMESELKKLGCNIKSSENEIFIEGNKTIKVSAELTSHNDHRIVMALSILATVADKEVIINNAEAIKKSYPNFFNDLRSLNIGVIEYDI